MEVARHAGKLALFPPVGGLEIKQIVKKIGSNRRVLDKKVLMDVVPPFDLVSEYRKEWELWADGVGIGVGTKEKDEEAKNQLVSLCRQIIFDVITFYKQEINKKN